MPKADTQWKDDIVDYSKLTLDLQNPRLPMHVTEHNDETQIRNYMLEKENIIRIARSISINGYHRSSISIVYKDGDRYVVLDGNRRLAASQLLANPQLVPTAKEKKEIETLSKRMDRDALANIKVTVAPSRKAAEKEIWDIHVKQLSKPWETLQKLRMYRNLIKNGDYNVKSAAFEYGITEAKFKDQLAHLFFYERLLEITDNKGEEELLKSGFNKIGRLIISKNGKKLLDYYVNNNGDVVIADNSEFECNLRKLEPYITQPGKVTAQSKQEDLVDKIYSVIDKAKFPIIGTVVSTGGLIPDAPVSTTVATPKDTLQKNPGTTTLPDWITESEFQSYVGAARVKNILQELKKNKPTKKQNLNIVAVSLRVVVELAIYDKLNSRGAIAAIVTAKNAEISRKNAERATKNQGPIPSLSSNWTPSLKEMLTHMVNAANGIISDPQERKALTRLMENNKEFVDDLDNFIHNVRYLPTESAVHDIWETFCRLVFDILKRL